MSKYGDLQYNIDRPEPSALFLKARQIAGYQLQERFNKFNIGDINSSNDGFKWIKAELTYPSFDHLTFAFKNAIFSVVIELIDEDQTSLSDVQIVRLFKAASENNLTPCIFRLRLINEQKKSFLSLFEPENFHHAKSLDLVPFNNEWNLYNIKTGDEIIPEKIGNEVKTVMSKWELQNFAIQIVRNDIEKEGGAILSFCDLLEVNPQIWFKDKEGSTCWVVVKHITQSEDENHLVWVGLEKKNPQLIPYDGFFASVQFVSTQSNYLYRSDGMMVNYVGLKRIYVS